MRAPVNVLDSHPQEVATVYLADYLKTLGSPEPPTFSRESFRQWLATDTHASGAYGLDYVLNGLNELGASGHLTGDNSNLSATPAFADILREQALYMGV